MAPLPAAAVPRQPDINTAFIRELQYKENRSKDEFLGHLLTNDNLSKDHIAVKTSQSGSSGSSNTRQDAKSKTRSACPKQTVDDPHYYTQLSVIEKPSMEFHRKRDFYSEYNEAAARFKLVLGNKKPLQKMPKEKGKDKGKPPSTGESTSEKSLEGSQKPFESESSGNNHTIATPDANKEPVIISSNDDNLATKNVVEQATSDPRKDQIEKVDHVR